ncbi:MAG: ATP-dependent helicase [Nitrospirae bacterium]|nr:MAG: ATP-dependent helicase [Nitrospirota bacterium]
MLVLAGAGTGKTTTVTYRVARLLEQGVPDSALLLLTFTNKAAREMMQRVEMLIGRKPSGLWGGTFHHVGNLILRRHASVIGYSEGFTIIDREDQKELMDSCLGELGLEDRMFPKSPVLVEMLSYLRNSPSDFDELIKDRYAHLSEYYDEIKRVFTLYSLRKETLNMMDFDDLLHNLLRLFREHDELRQWYSSRFLHILVDEYQDTNLIQSEMVDLLGATHRNLMVVGDDAQSIYSFRGARIENILGFPERYPDCRIFRLTTNYRSSPEILELSNASIAHNERQFEKNLKAVRTSGEKPMVVELQDLFEQASFVASRIIELSDEGLGLNSIAVLYRSHYQSMELQLELQRRGIPFEVRSGLRFFEQAHIKDILAYLKVMHNPYDELSWKRILKMLPGVGNVTATKIWNEISATDSPLDALRAVKRGLSKRALESYRVFVSLMEDVKSVDYRNHPADAIAYFLERAYEGYLYNTYPNASQRYDDILQLIRYAERYSSDSSSTYDALELLLSDLALESIGFSEEETPEDNQFVVLSSVHQAKGLEWKVVFVIGLNEGRFPSKKALHSEGEEEERRLFYVACTRAMEELYLCYTLTDDGYSNILKPSRFITELPEDCYERVEIEYGYS